MQLEINGLDLAANPFSSIWGRYVSGFHAEHHCQKCLKKVGDDLTQFVTDVPMPLRTNSEYFYLCALGRPRSAASNVHLAVKSKEGSVASVGSLYGVTFTIRDALAVRIKTLPIGWRGLNKAYTQCPNFQFAVQSFGYPNPDGSLDFGQHWLISNPVQQAKE